jgi:hypothetical protein
LFVIPEGDLRLFLFSVFPSVFAFTLAFAITLFSRSGRRIPVFAFASQIGRDLPGGPSFRIAKVGSE